MIRGGALVMQEPTRWPLTARDAVTLGRPDRADPDEEILHRVATDSGADTVLADLTHGWDALLTTQFRDGNDLSGGQWQRLAVARALYRDAAVLIRDEPTAAGGRYAKLYDLQARSYREDPAM